MVHGKRQASEGMLGSNQSNRIEEIKRLSFRLSVEVEAEHGRAGRAKKRTANSRAAAQEIGLSKGVSG